MAPEDPGWRRAIRGLPFVLVPVLVSKNRVADEPRVLVLRAAFLAFVAALLGLLAVLLMLFPLTSTEPVDGIVYALVAVGPVGLAAIPWARRRLIGFCGTPAELAGAYTTSVFLSIAFVQSPALLGFAATFLAEALWPYLVGMLVALVGYAAIAPTSARIRRLDETLSTRGCHRSLRVGLFVPSGEGEVD